MIDRHDTRPAYQQIADEIAARIANGDLGPGKQIPTRDEIRRAHGVSGVTVQRAIDVLDTRGLIERRQGGGVYVRPRRRLLTTVASSVVRTAKDDDRKSWREQATAAGMLGTQRILAAGRAAAPLDVAEPLNLDGDEVVFRDRILYLDDDPVMFVSSYYPLDVAEGTRLDDPRPMRGGALPVLEAKGFKLGHFSDRERARLATPEEARRLDLGPTAPVSYLVRTLFTTDGRPIEVTVMIRNGERLETVWEYPAITARD